MQPVIEPLESDVTVETSELGTWTLLPVRVKLLLCENVGTALKRPCLSAQEILEKKNAAHKPSRSHTHIPRTKRIP